MTGWLTYDALAEGMDEHLTGARSARSLLDEMAETGVLDFDAETDSYALSEAWSDVKFLHGNGESLVEETEEEEGVLVP